MPQGDTIQWFPGHMAKTRRLITENLGDVDVVIELRDARIPFSSMNPEIKRLTGTKPMLTLLNKASLADPDANRSWLEVIRRRNAALLTDCITGEGVSAISGAVREILRDKIEKYESKGMAGRRLRAMIVGIPNCGKSSLVNRLCGGKKAKVEDRPGVTLAKQWVSTSAGIDLLDMPGVLWPKFDDKIVGENLALTGAIRDAVYDTEGVAVILCRRMRAEYPGLLASRYKLDPAMMDDESVSDYDLFLAIGRKRGFILPGAEINEERTAAVLLDEFRGGMIGRITLETPKSGQ